MTNPEDRFLNPQNRTHREYEALRALFVDELSIAEVARRFGYAPKTLRKLRADFVNGEVQPFFLPDQRGRRIPPPGPDRNERIIALRSEQNLSAADIAHHLTRNENMPVSASTVARVIRQAGMPTLWRRVGKQRVQPVQPPSPNVDAHRHS